VAVLFLGQVVIQLWVEESSDVPVGQTHAVPLLICPARLQRHCCAHLSNTWPLGHLQPGDDPSFVGINPAGHAGRHMPFRKTPPEGHKKLGPGVEGAGLGVVDGVAEGVVDGVVDGVGEGVAEGAGLGVAEGVADGVATNPSRVNVRHLSAM